MEILIGYLILALFWMALAAYVLTCGYAVYAYISDERMLRRRERARVRVRRRRI